jgi:glyceraldehyde 3-phosphate dehydrogenase
MVLLEKTERWRAASCNPSSTGGAKSSRKSYSGIKWKINRYGVPTTDVSAVDFSKSEETSYEEIMAVLKKCFRNNNERYSRIHRRFSSFSRFCGDSRTSIIDANGGIGLNSTSKLFHGMITNMVIQAN